MKKIMCPRKSGRTYAEKLQKKFRKLLYDTPKQKIRDEKK
jgi:hypothetical protein